MSPVYISFIPILMMLLIIFAENRKNANLVAFKIIKKRKLEGKTEMLELAKRFIDKECIIYTFNGSQIVGVIKEVVSGALLVEKGGNIEAVNVEFIMRIREYPRNKKGKKKAIVAD